MTVPIWGAERGTNPNTELKGPRNGIARVALVTASVVQSSKRLGLLRKAGLCVRRTEYHGEFSQQRSRGSARMRVRGLCHACSGREGVDPGRAQATGRGTIRMMRASMSQRSSSRVELRGNRRREPCEGKRVCGEGRRKQRVRSTCIRGVTIQVGHGVKLGHVLD